MRQLSYLFAAAAISGLALTAAPSSASPLASGLIGGNSIVPEITEGLVQKIHGRHCRRRVGPFYNRWEGDWDYGRHSHCRQTYYRPRPFFAPSFGLFFNFDDDDGRRRRGKHGKRDKD